MTINCRRPHLSFVYNTANFMTNKYYLETTICQLLLYSFEVFSDTRVKAILGRKAVIVNICNCSQSQSQGCAEEEFPAAGTHPEFFWMTQHRVWNFSAGPSAMPLEVLEKIQREMICHGSSGQSVLEMSHRSKEFIAIWDKAEKDLRDILGVPGHFKVLNLQGGATLQFASIPLNMLGGGGSVNCDYLVTGAWSEKAAKEAAKYGMPSEVCNGKKSNFTSVPAVETWKFDNDARYTHYCDNETVHGVEFSAVPESPSPLVADMSSNFMSRSISFEKHSVVYAGIQKNLGPAGNTIVLIDEKFLGKNELSICPTYCSWKTAADAGSMYNTPACFSVYAMGVYLEHTKSKGGLHHWEQLAKHKSTLLYDAIDHSDGFFTGPVAKDSRSRMNVPFQIRKGDEALEKRFLDQASKRGLINLAGHRSVGGIRASLYNGMPLEGVHALVDFMKDFQQENQ